LASGLLFISAWHCAAMTEPTRRGVHLFHDSILIAHLTTENRSPDTSYLVDGVSYRVVSFTGPYLEHDGGEGWDVQVTPSPTGHDDLTPP
jgi:hypothetical protein